MNITWNGGLDTLKKSAEIIFNYVLFLSHFNQLWKAITNQESCQHFYVLKRPKKSFWKKEEGLSSSIKNFSLILLQATLDLKKSSSTKVNTTSDIRTWSLLSVRFNYKPDHKPCDSL